MNVRFCSYVDFKSTEKSMGKASEKKESDANKELEEQLKRVQADYANYRRRTEERREQEVLRGKKQLVQEILSVVDNLELALKQVKKQDQAEFYKGVELIYGQLVTALEQQGVKRIDAETFDPAMHEVLLTEASKEPKGTILEVLQQGYMLGSDVLRSAKVKLSSGGKSQ